MSSSHAKQKQNTLILVFLLSLSVFLVSCGMVQQPIPGTFAVGDNFKAFYKNAGGRDVLGPALSATILSGNIEYQYVSAGLMYYDPSRAPAQQFGFYPLAREHWNIRSIPDPPPVETSIPYLNGHTVWEDAWLLYNRLGSSVIGVPLTGVITNNEKQRYEQYCEGLGFYRDFNAPPNEIHLMPYGEWACTENCTYFFGDTAAPARMIDRPTSEVEQIFMDYAERPGYAFTGAPIGIPQYAMDGYVEMTFENIIMYFDPENPYPVMLRPLPIWLGMAQEPPVFSLGLDWLDFREAYDGLGYDIPVFLSDFIISHGGFELVGEPLTHYQSLPDGGYKQCYTNMCLEYHPGAPIFLRVHGSPLGAQYLSQGSPLRVFVNLSDTNFPANQPVTLDVYALQNGEILKNIMFELVISLPIGNAQNYFVSPDSEDGVSSVTISPLDLPQGSRVSYQACAVGMVGEQECAMGTFTIWGR
jgi:hypothetical protein